MTAGVPFGFGLPANLKPEDIAALLGRAPLGPAQSFAPPDAPQPAQPTAPQAPDVVPAEMKPSPLPPPRPPSLAGRPAEPSAPVTPDPVATTGAITPAPLAPARAPEPAENGGAAGFARKWKDLADTGIFDQGLAFAGGLLSAPGGEGWGKAFDNLSRVGATTAATDLAKTKVLMEQQKVVRENAALTANGRYVQSKIPGISPEQALAFGGNSTFMNELLKGALPPQELFKQFTDADGNRWNRNERTGQETVALKAEDDKTVTPVSETDRVALGLPAGSYQKDANGKISPINPTGTTINMGAEKAQDATVGKGYGDYQLDLATKGRNAGSTLNTLALMEQAMKKPGFYSGVGGDAMKRANQFLGALGVKDPKAASAAEVFDALSNKVVLDGLGGSLGPGISNTDRDYIARTAPTLAQSEQGNRDLIGVARTLAQRQQAVSQLARDYAAKNGGRIDAGFDQALDAFARDNPLFPQAAGSATASAPKEPPQGAPAGTRLAPDGKFYAPDPNRPGRFMQVQ